MWLLPYLSAVSGAAVRLYYRASRSGGTVPHDGPVLIVSNHPNSLLDPAVVAWAAQRPVRFLAKAPLFRHRLVGWLVRGSGALPVYRRQDDAALIGRNDETFRAVHAALGAGAAVAIFPEGTSHSEPGLVPIKSGAARIALGATHVVGGAFPIVPVGLVLREKDRFRSEAHVVVGAPVAWDDLAATPGREAVRELTERIEQGIRAVTINLARWEDEPVIRTAESIWAAERNAERTPAARVQRLARATDALAQLRADDDERWAALADDVADHAQTLAAFGLRPADVRLDTGFGPAAGWALRRLRIAGLVQFAIAALAVLIFWVPYRVTGMIAGRLTESRDAVSTYKALGGAFVFILWIVALSLVAASMSTWRVGLVVFALLPALAIAGLYAAERWERTLLQARRWLILRRRGEDAVSLRQRQQDLARRLDDALAAHESIP